MNTEILRKKLLLLLLTKNGIPGRLAEYVLRALGRCLLPEGRGTLRGPGIGIHHPHPMKR